MPTFPRVDPLVGALKMYFMIFDKHYILTHATLTNLSLKFSTSDRHSLQAYTKISPCATEIQFFVTNGSFEMQLCSLSGVDHRNFIRTKEERKTVAYDI